MRVDYGRGEEEAIFSAHTLMVYEQEFRSNLISDLFGLAVVRAPEEEDEDVLMRVDYRDVNWNALLKALWAGLKTADEGVPPFSKWHLDLPDLNLWELNDALMPEMIARFFRTGAGGTE